MSSEQTSKTEQTPFSGVSAERYNSFYPYLQGQLNDQTGYTQPMTSPINATQQQAISGLQTGATNQNLQDYASGKYLDPSTNPYLKSSVDQIQQSAKENFNQAAQGIDTRFANRGFYDSSAHAGTLDRTADLANRNVANATSNLYGNAYQQGVGNMLNAQGAQQSANAALLSGGNTQYGISDTALQRQYSDYLNQQGFKQQDISNLLNYLQIGKNPTTTQTSNDGGAGAGQVVGQLGAATISCFAAGTMIETIGNPIAIEDIRVGDVVQGRLGALKVIRITEPTLQESCLVGSGNRSTTTTYTQPFLTAKGLVDVVNLSIGDVVDTIDGPMAITNIDIMGKTLVYDFTTEGENIFFADGFAVEGGF